MKNINLIKVISIGGTVLGLAGSLLSSHASKKTMDETIKKEVAKALQEQSK